MKYRYWPFAARIPVFLAEARPIFSWWITWKRLSFLQYSSQIAGDESVDPSSTRITS
jgi:hypothetical protein